MYEDYLKVRDSKMRLASKEIYSETRTLYLTNCERIGESFLDVNVPTADYKDRNTKRRQIWENIFDKVSEAVNRRDFLLAGGYIRKMSEFVGDIEKKPDDEQRIYDCANASLGVKSTLKKADLIEIEAFVRLLIWNGTGLTLRDLPDAPQLILDTIDLIEVQDIERSFKLASYWQNADSNFYIGYKSPVSLEKVQSIYQKGGVL